MLLPNVFHTNDMFALSGKSAEKKTKTGRLPIAHYKQKPSGSDLWPVNRCIPSIAPLWHFFSLRASLYLIAPKTLEIYFMKVFILYRLCYSFAKSLILFRLLLILSGRRYSLQIIINNSRLIVIISNGFKYIQFDLWLFSTYLY